MKKKITQQDIENERSKLVQHMQINKAQSKWFEQFSNLPFMLTVNMSDSIYKDVLDAQSQFIGAYLHIVYGDEEMHSIDKFLRRQTIIRNRSKYFIKLIRTKEPSVYLTVGDLQKVNFRILVSITECAEIHLFNKKDKVWDKEIVKKIIEQATSELGINESSKVIEFHIKREILIMNVTKLMLKEDSSVYV